MTPTDRPWWADHLPTPDIRSVATLLMFAMIFYMLWLIANVPTLAANELFKTVATLLVGSGAFGLVCAFLWGGSKASVAAADTVNAMATASTVPQVTAPAATTQTVNVAAPVADEAKP